MNYFRCGGGRSTHTATKIDIAKTPLATFESNVSGLYIPEILAYITATQSGSGDPSPTNPRTINGVDSVSVACNAVNQWDEQWELGSIDNSGADESSTTRIRSKNYILVSPNTTYYFVWTTPSTNAIRLYHYDGNNQFISYAQRNLTSFEFTTPDNCRYIRFRTAGTGTVTTYNNDISINYPSTDTSYHAYNGTTATTALPTTCYGGYLNLETGVLTRTHGRGSISNLGLQWDGEKFISNALQNVIETPVSSSLTVDFKAEALKYMSYFDFVLADNAIVVTTSGYIAIKASAYGSSVSDLETAIGNTYIIYQLATPTTEQLTPHQIEQLLGQNNVFCSTGDVEVKYWKID